MTVNTIASPDYHLLGGECPENRVGNALEKLTLQTGECS